MQPFLSSRLDMDAYFRLLDAEAGHPENLNNASEWEQNLSTDMNDLGPFPSEAMFSDDIDFAEAFFHPDQGQYSSLLSSTLPASLPAPFPSNAVYTQVPEYVPNLTIPTSDSEPNDLYFVRILINCITAMLESERHRQWDSMALMPSPFMMASDFAVPFPPQHSSTGGDQQQMVPSNHSPVMQQPGPSHSTSVPNPNPGPRPRGKDNGRKSGSRRKRNTGQKHRAVEDASVRRYRRYVSYCPFHCRGLTAFQHCAVPLDYPSPSSLWRHSSERFRWESLHTHHLKSKNQLTRYCLSRSGPTVTAPTFTRARKRKGQDTHLGTVAFRVNPVEAEAQPESPLNRGEIPGQRFRHEVPPQEHENDIVRDFVESGPEWQPQQP